MENTRSRMELSTELRQAERVALKAQRDVMLAMEQGKDHTEAAEAFAAATERVWNLRKLLPHRVKS